LAAITEEEEEVVEKLWKKRERHSTCLAKKSTGDKVERVAKWCQESLSKVLDAKMNTIRICSLLKKWWNSELKERRSTLKNDKRW
jgi:hypothetical protein